MSPAGYDPIAAVQREVRDVERPELIGPGGLGLVQQPVWDAAQPVRGIGRAWSVALGLQGEQPPAHGRAQALRPTACPFWRSVTCSQRGP